MPATTIAEVIDRLDVIVRDARRDREPLGYFAVLYRNVTRRVRDAIEAGDFDDGPRMELLDVVFANRYLEAYERHRAGESPGRAWGLAFEQAGRWWPVVLQHLLLGINAHINLDLGIAAADTAPGGALRALKGDFERINGILASMVGGVQDDLAEVWPALKVLDWLGRDADEAVINFAMKRARDHAWSVAERVNGLTGDARTAAIEAADAEALGVGRRVASPGWRLTIPLRLVRVTEIGGVSRKMDVLQ